MANKAASELARARWKKTSAEERKQFGQALAESRKSIPANVRKAAAQTAARARWDNTKKSGGRGKK